MQNKQSACFIKIIIYLLPILLSFSAHATPPCVCKCVIKDADEKITTLEAQGKDREAAGENLKKKLQKNKCILSPTCSGKCSLDS